MVSFHDKIDYIIVGHGCCKVHTRTIIPSYGRYDMSLLDMAASICSLF